MCVCWGVWDLVVVGLHGSGVFGRDLFKFVFNWWVCLVGVFLLFVGGVFGFVLLYGCRHFVGCVLVLLLYVYDVCCKWWY